MVQPAIEGELDLMDYGACCWHVYPRGTAQCQTRAGCGCHRKQLLLSRCLVKKEETWKVVGMT